MRRINLRDVWYVGVHEFDTTTGTATLEINGLTSGGKEVELRIAFPIRQQGRLGLAVHESLAKAKGMVAEAIVAASPK